MVTVYLAFGSNLGDRPRLIDLARFLLEKKGIHLCAASPYYESEAVTKDGSQGSPYLNGVFQVETDLTPELLLDRLEEIERLIGRESKEDWAPRPIDLDILFYGDQVVRSERLMIPHPRLAQRWFVLKPLLDIAPDLVHPVLGKKVREVFDADLH